MSSDARGRGGDTVHLPQMTILHRSSSTASNATLNAQMAHARRQYMTKHFTPFHRFAATVALGIGYALRSIKPGRGAAAPARRASSRAALSTLIGLKPPPFGAHSSVTDTRPSLPKASG